QTAENWLVSGSSVNLFTWTYDSQGNQLTAKNNTGAYTFTYDALDRVTTQKDPSGQLLTYTLDGVGNVQVVQDSQGGISSSAYDAANRLTQRLFGGSGQTPLRMDITYTARD